MAPWCKLSPHCPILTTLCVAICSDVNNELADAQREVLALRDDNSALQTKIDDRAQSGKVSNPALLDYRLLLRVLLAF